MAQCADRSIVSPIRRPLVAEPRAHIFKSRLPLSWTAPFLTTTTTTTTTTVHTFYPLSKPFSGPHIELDSLGRAFQTMGQSWEMYVYTICATHYLLNIIISSFNADCRQNMGGSKLGEQFFESWGRLYNRLLVPCLPP